jgi:5-methylcytosine-specific restriction endonuclease McrA
VEAEVAGSLREGVKAMSARYARWRTEQWREFPERLHRRECRRDAKRWTLARAKVPPGPCHYCGAPDARHVDHVIPRNQGGTHDLSNLVRACKDCNLAKGCRTPEQWRRGESVTLFWERGRRLSPLLAEHRKRENLTAPTFAAKVVLPPGKGIAWKLG